MRHWQRPPLDFPVGAAHSGLPLSPVWVCDRRNIQNAQTYLSAYLIKQEKGVFRSVAIAKRFELSCSRRNPL